jgi:hypothetical protein
MEEEEIGYFFEEVEIEEFDDETYYTDRRWEIFPDGTFTCNTQKSWEHWDQPEEGIFERSRYEELVNQMKELKTDWIDELTYIPDDEYFHDGLATSYKCGKWGFIDKKGVVVIPYIYDHTEDFHEGFARVLRNGKWGFVDNTGREVVPCQYEKVWNFHEGFAWVLCNEKWGFVDNTGREVIPCKYVRTMHFQEGKAQVNENDTQDSFSFARSWIYIDKTGRRIIEKKTENDSASQKISDPDDDLPF